MEEAIRQFLLHACKQNTMQGSRAVHWAGEGGDSSGRQARSQGQEDVMQNPAAETGTERA